MEPLLPHNIDAETGVLGSLLIDPEAMRHIADLLEPDDFYRAAHRDIFAAALDLFNASGPADLITLTDELQRRGKLEEVGGISYVSSLANHVPTSANVAHYAQIVARCGYNRRLIAASGQLAAVGYQDNALDTTRDLVDALFAKLVTRGRRGALRSFAQVLDDLHDDVLARMDLDRFPGVRTGIGALDAHILGIEPGELVYLGGRPGSGKSALGLRVALNAAFECRRYGAGAVDVITLEMSARAQARRLISGLAEVNTRFIRSGFRTRDGADLDAYEHFRQAWAHYREEVGDILHFWDAPLSLAGLRAHALRGVADRGLRLLVIDQLDLLSERARDEYQRITALSRELKQIAHGAGVAVLCLVQLNRAVEERQNKRPMLSDLRQSGQLEQDADMVWGLYRPSYYEPRSDDATWEQFAELIMLKVRDGASGGMVPLRFEKQVTRFSDWPFERIPADATRAAQVQE